MQKSSQASHCLLISICIFIVVAYWGNFAFAQLCYFEPSELCDSTLRPISICSLAYHYRGNRCEGFYRSRITNDSTLELVNITKEPIRFELNEKEILEVSSPVVAAQLVHVQAVGIPIKLYYRLDAQVQPAQTINWPIRDALLPGEIADRKIGVYGWIEKKGTKVYVPIQVHSSLTSGSPDEKIHVIFRASVNVHNVQQRLYTLINDECLRPEQWKNVSDKSYDAGEPIHITLPPDYARGVCVELAAEEEERLNEWLSIRVKVILEE